MARSSALRASKYAAKVSGDVAKNRIDAQRDSMISQMTTQAGNLEAIESLTRTLLSGWGVPTPMIPAYLAFARQCYAIQRKHSGTIALNEICIAHDKWSNAQRGCDSFYLQTIAMDVFTVNIASCT